jgi:hypothetical protein
LEPHKTIADSRQSRGPLTIADSRQSRGPLLVRIPPKLIEIRTPYPDL